MSTSRLADNACGSASSLQPPGDKVPDVVRGIVGWMIRKADMALRACCQRELLKAQRPGGRVDIVVVLHDCLGLRQPFQFNANLGNAVCWTPNAKRECFAVLLLLDRPSRTVCLHTPCQGSVTRRQ